MTCTEHSHEVLRCLDCDYQKFVEGDSYAEHVYTSKVTRKATCQVDGEITFTCEKCGDTFVQSYSEPEAHNFVLKTDVDGVKTYHCDHEGCEEIKTVIDYSQQSSAEVSTEQLQSAGEVQFENAAIAFDDETLEEFGESVSIAAEKVENNEQIAEELSLNEEEQEMLEGKPIIDFSVTKGSGDSEEKISEFAGSVKVTIPYELQANEDPNGSAIWYLSENGTEPMQAAYVNGNVSFETTHFSYYAVVHLSPEEVCASFGHEMVKGQKVNSTCAVHGYDDMICRRCNKIDRTVLPLNEHDWHFVEKLEPTSTSTGYVRYECSVCHSLDERIIPMININPEDGFYVNLVKSILTPEFKQHSELTLNGENQVSENYKGLDYEGMPFEYDSSGRVCYKGYSYSDYYYRYQYYDSSAQMMQMIATIIDYIPQIYKDNFEDIVGWIVNNYFVVAETDEGLTFSLNHEALLATYQLLTHEKLSVAIPAIIGEETWESILGFIEAHYGDTVGEFIEAIEAKGYLVSELYQAFVSVSTLFGQDPETIPALEEILTDDIKNMTLLEMLEMLIQMASGSQGQGSEGHEEYIPDEHEGEGHEEEGKPSREMLPPTYTDFKEMLDQYLDMRLLDIVLSFVMLSIPESAASIVTEELVNSYVDLFASVISDEKVNLILKTTSNGAFISFEIVVRDLYIPSPIEGQSGESVEYASVVITKSFDKSEILKKCEAVASKYEKVSGAFALNEDNYEWLAKAYEDYFGQSYPGFELEYKRDYLNNGRDALVSNVEVELDIGTDYDYSTEMDVIRKETGLLIIYLNVKGDDYSYYKDYITNNSGLGTVLEKGESAIRINTERIVGNLELRQINGEDEVSSSIYVSGACIPSFDILFTLDDYHYVYSDARGTFDYFYNVENVKPVLSTVEEYNAYVSGLPYWGGTLPSEQYSADEYYIIKYVNKDTGNVSRFNAVHKYNSTYQHIDNLRVINSNMNELALQHIRDFEISYYIVDGAIVDTVELRTPYANYWGGKENNKFDFNYSYRNGEYNEEAFSKDYSFSVSYGNVTATYSAKTTSKKCQRDVSYRIKIGNTIIASGSHRSHISWHGFNSTKILSTITIDSCHDLVTYQSYCSECGKITGTWTSNSSHHSYDWEHSVHYTLNPTLTKAGFTYSYVTCSECGERNIYSCSYLRPCCHENAYVDEETGLLICPDCGYSVESENGEVPELIYELFSEDNETIKYSVFSPRLSYYSEYINLNDYYIFSLAIGYKDESGEFITVHNLNEGQVTSEMVRFDNEIFDYWYGEESPYYLCFTISFSNEMYQDLLASVKAEHPDSEVSATILAVSRESGTIFVYAI